MSGTLEELTTELDSIKRTLHATSKDGTENPVLAELVSMVQAASKAAEDLRKQRGDWRLKNELKGSLLDIREAMKNPELSGIINTNLIDNLKKFFQPPPSPKIFTGDEPRQTALTSKNNAVRRQRS